jgi:putative NADH-flavin reductase
MSNASNSVKRVVIFGAGGRVGQLLTAEVLRREIAVKAVLRDPSKLALRHDLLTVTKGDVLRAEDVVAGVEGVDAVLSAVGQRRGSAHDTMTQFGGHLVSAMERAQVTRVVSLLGAAVVMPGDGPPDFGRRLVMTAMKLLARHVLEDAQRHADILRASSLAWTIARPPRIVDGPPRATIEAAAFRSLGGRSTITAADVARFMMSELVEQKFVREAPMITSS